MKVLIFLVFMLLIFPVYAKESFEVGRYIVSGDHLEDFGDAVRVFGDEETIIQWTGNPGEVCVGDCKVSLTGVGCVIKKTGVCSGRSLGEVILETSISPDESFEYDFGDSMVTFNLESLDFEFPAGEFYFNGDQVISDSVVSFYGDTLVSDGSFKVGDLEVSCGGEFCVSSVSLGSDKFSAGENTELTYKGLVLKGNGQSYDLCLDEDSCPEDKSFVLFDRDSDKFFAKGIGSGPSISFLEDNGFLDVERGSAFEVSDFNDASMEIIKREDKVPYVEFNMLVKDKKYLTKNVKLTNGKVEVYNNYGDMKYSKFSLNNDDSVPMTVRFLVNDKDLLNSEEDYKILISSYNEFKLVPDSAVEGFLNEESAKLRGLSGIKISETIESNTKEYDFDFLKSQLRTKVPNLNSVEGFSRSEMKRLFDSLNRFPSELTTKVKSITFLEDEEFREKYGLDAFAFAGNNGDIVLSSDGVRERFIRHELAHLWDSSNTDSEVLNELDGLYSKLTLLEKEDPKNLEITGIKSRITELQDNSGKLPDWASLNDNQDMKTVSGDYCSSKIQGGLIWKGASKDEQSPRHGVMRAYGCTSASEDFATFNEAFSEKPESFVREVRCPPPNVYAKKIMFLVQEGLITQQEYENIFPEEKRKCMEENL